MNDTIEKVLMYIFEGIGLFIKVEEGQQVVTPIAPPAQGWSKNIVDCDPILQKAYPIVKAQFESENPGYTLKLDYTWRSPAFQFTLFQEGRELQNGVWVVVDQAKVVTDEDGTLHKSAHNCYPAKALDCLIVYNGEILWALPNTPQIQLYNKLGQLFVNQGLISGALWKFNWKDPDHVQTSYNF